VYDGRLFFGAGDGKINEFGTVYYDGVPTVSGGISATLRTAWVRPQPGTNISWRSLKNYFRSTEAGISISYDYTMDYDIASSSLYAFVWVPPTEAAWGDPWGTAWGGSLLQMNDWHGVAQFGEAISVRWRMSVGNRVEYYGGVFSVEGGYVL
jgi:hypothetical protein